jgi:hypothetical protein
MTLYQRNIARIGILFVLPLVGLVWIIIGVASPYRLGLVLEKTGLNLQDYNPHSARRAGREPQ